MTEVGLRRILYVLLFILGTLLFVFNGIATQWFIVRGLAGTFAAIYGRLVGADVQPFLIFLDLV